MNVSLIDDIQTLLFHLSLPIAEGPTTPMVLLVTVRQRTSAKSEEIPYWWTAQGQLPIARGGHGDFIVIVEETLNEAVVGVVVIDEECRRDGTFVRVSMCWIENRSYWVECLGIQITHERQHHLGRSREQKSIAEL